MRMECRLCHRDSRRLNSHTISSSSSSSSSSSKTVVNQKTLVHYVEEGRT